MKRYHYQLMVTGFAALYLNACSQEKKTSLAKSNAVESAPVNTGSAEILAEIKAESEIVGQMQAAEAVSVAEAPAPSSPAAPATGDAVVVENPGVAPEAPSAPGSDVTDEASPSADVSTAEQQPSIVLGVEALDKACKATFLYFDALNVEGAEPKLDVAQGKACFTALKTEVGRIITELSTQDVVLKLSTAQGPLPLSQKLYEDLAARGTLISDAFDSVIENRRLTEQVLYLPQALEKLNYLDNAIKELEQKPLDEQVPADQQNLIALLLSRDVQNIAVEKSKLRLKNLSQLRQYMIINGYVAQTISVLEAPTPDR